MPVIDPAAVARGPRTPVGTFEPYNSEQLRGFGRWKDFVHDNFPWLEHRDLSAGSSGCFEAQVSRHRFVNSSLATIRTGASEVIRTRHLAASAESGYIKLLWQISGDMHLEQDGRRCQIGRGEATVCDTTRPYRIRLSEQAHFAVLMVPHEACPGWERISQRLCGVPLSDAATLHAAFGALLSLLGVPPSGDGEAQETVLRAVQWMLAASMHRSASEMGINHLHNLRLNRVQQLIHERIADPDLDADALAAALCISRRSLYLLFKEHGLTPTKVIHDVRLERSLQALGDSSQQHRKITDIAFDCGFGDYATFSRLFKAQYGLTPSDYRLKSRAPLQ